MSSFSTFSKPGNSGIVFQNIAALKAYTDLTPINNKTVDVLGYFTPSDGGGGTFYYNPLNNLADNAGMNIKPTIVGVAAGAFERVYAGDIEAAYFGAIGDLENITVDVNAAAGTATKKGIGLKGIVTGWNGFSSSNLYRYWGNGIIGSQATTGADGNATNIIQMHPTATPVPLVGDIVEQFRGGVWVRIGVVYTAHVGDGYRVSNELGLINDTIFYQTRVSGPTSVAFKTSDVGRTMVIEGARLWTAYNTMPVGLNCKITAINSGVATIVNLDTARGVLNDTTGLFSGGNPVPNAVVFRDATDGIAKAIKHCEDNNKDSPLLPAGTLGVMPFHSTTWAAKPAFGTLPNTVEKSPFWFSKNVGLRGRGKGKSILSVHYAVPNRVGVYNPQSSPGIHVFHCVLFFCEPILNTETIKYFKDFTVRFPRDLSVSQPYDCFRDIGNNAYITPTRHGQKVYADINIDCPDRNVAPFRSNYGDVYTHDFDAVTGFTYRGIYDAGATYVENDVYMDAAKKCYYMFFNGTNLNPKLWHNRVLMHAGIYFKNCMLECAGFEIKHSELYGDPSKICGKEFHVIDSKLTGGAIVHYRDFTGTYTKTGAEYFLEIVEKEYSPFLFNNHFYKSTINVFNTPIEIKKRNTHTISNIVISGNNYIVTLSTNYADVTKANAKMWFDPGEKLTELYLDAEPASGGVSVTNGSPTVTVPISATQRTLDEMHHYIGKTVRLYSRIDYVMLTDFQNNRKIKVGQWNTTAAIGGVTYPITEACLNELCDVTINATFREAGQGAKGHPIYNHNNLNTKFERFIVEECPDVFRISDGTTNKGGLFTIKDSPQPKTRGKAVRGTGFFTEYQIYYQCQGAVDIDNAGDFVNDFAISGSIKNCKTLTGFPFIGGKIENCTLRNMSLSQNKIEINKCFFDYPITRPTSDIVVTNSNGLLFVNGGKVLIKDSEVGLQLFYDQGSPAVNLPLTDVTFLDTAVLSSVNLGALSAGERIIARNAIKFTRSGLKATHNDGLGIVNDIPMDISIKRGRYPNIVTYNAGFTLALPQAYPVAVINRTAMGIPSAGSGRILYIDGGVADEYTIGATTIDEIRFSNYLVNLSMDFNLFAQYKHRNGVSIVLVPTEDGFITNSGAKLTPLITVSRAVGVPIRFVNDKVNGLWYEVPNVFYN